MAGSDDQKPRWPTDVALVRQTLMRELETINAYEEFASQASSEDVRIFLKHLADDEKEHVAEATALLRALDAVQEQFFQQDVSIEHMKGGHADRPASGGAHAPIDRKPLGLTVGSLKRREGT
ncbi:MAG: hypothetical protein ACK4N5_19860 [Myxococcales bacterium]